MEYQLSVAFNCIKKETNTRNNEYTKIKHSRRCSRHWKVHLLLLDFTIISKFQEDWKCKFGVIGRHSMKATAFATIKWDIMAFVAMSTFINTSWV